MQRIRLIAFLACGATYLLIVLGGVVRITGSGMGCGDNWPLCNGRFIPPLNDTAALIEWGHRLVAFGVSVLVIGLAALAVARRGATGVAGRGGPLRPALLAVALLLLQVALGAVTVWMELPPTTVILHLGTAMAMIAALEIVGLRARDIQLPVPGAGQFRRGALVALGLAGAAVLMGAVTANLGAAGACVGFPLCSGEFWPSESNGGLTHIHWLHRLVAYGLTLHLVGLVSATIRRSAPVAVQRAAIVALGVTLVQIAVAAAMMFSVLQPHWRATHVAAGTAVWVVAVVLAWVTRAGHSASDHLSGTPTPAAPPPSG